MGASKKIITITIIIVTIVPTVAIIIGSDYTIETDVQWGVLT